MTKKDYELCAGALRAMRPGRNDDAIPWVRVIAELATAFKRANPRFKAGKFALACGATDAPAARALAVLLGE